MNIINNKLKEQNDNILIFISTCGLPMPLNTGPPTTVIEAIPRN